MYNPRFPHKLYLKRPKKDANGEIILGYSGNPQYEAIPINKVEMFDNEPVRNEDGTFQTILTPYIEFGYRTETQATKTEGDVIVNHKKLSTPMFTNIFEYGDIVEIVDYERTYRANVIDKRSFNWGSYIFINEIHN